MKKRTRFIHKINIGNTDWRKMSKWEIFHRNNQNKLSKIYSLCNLERFEIALADNNNLLNLRSDWWKNVDISQKFI